MVWVGGGGWVVERYGVEGKREREEEKKKSLSRMRSRSGTTQQRVGWVPDSPPRTSRGPSDLARGASAPRARAGSRPRRAPAHESPGPASRGVIRGGARGGRAAGGRRYGASVVTWSLVTAVATLPALFSFWSGRRVPRAPGRD